jgi:hypothetical protein
MPAMFVLDSEDQATDEASLYSGDELVVLVVLDRATLATDFDNRMAGMERKAHELKKGFEERGGKCRVMMEWGDKLTVVANALQREQASLLNKV